MKPAVLVALTAAFAFVAAAQDAKTSPKPLTFEVAAIKPNHSGSGRSSDSTSHGRMTAINVSVRYLIQLAFGVKDFQISGGPGWLTDNYDINANTGTSQELSDKDFERPLQALLADRFQFRYHRETKEAQVYLLVPAKTGPRLTAHAKEEGAEDDSSNNVSNGDGKTSMSCKGTPMSGLADLLGRRLDRVVIDNTGLAGTFDFQLEWVPNATVESAGVSLFTALQEQLGLRLESAKAPVQMIVIDSVERPSEN